MSQKDFSRRGLFASTALAAASTTVIADDAKHVSPGTFKTALNTATIRGQKLPLDREVAIAIQAGYDGIEPWVSTVDAYRKAGGSLDDMRKRCADAGLAVVSAIGFANWIVDDDTRRGKALEQMKREMDMLRAIGGTHIAAPPAGANRGPRIALDVIAERYHALCEVGRNAGVKPQVEAWGSSTNLSKVSELVYVATASGHADACILSDAYHMYRGGSAPSAARAMSKTMTHCFHINDYPDIEREKIKDSDRVMPGDGIAPLGEILGAMHNNGCTVYLSLELFSKRYWERDAMAVAKEGVVKTNRVISSGLWRRPADKTRSSR